MQLNTHNMSRRLRTVCLFVLKEKMFYRELSLTLVPILSNIVGRIRYFKTQENQISSHPLWDFFTWQKTENGSWCLPGYCSRQKFIMTCGRVTEEKVRLWNLMIPLLRVPEIRCLHFSPPPYLLSLPLPCSAHQSEA